MGNKNIMVKLWRYHQFIKNIVTAINMLYSSCKQKYIKNIRVPHLREEKIGIRIMCYEKTKFKLWLTCFIYLFFASPYNWLLNKHAVQALFIKSADHFKSDPQGSDPQSFEAQLGFVLEKSSRKNPSNCGDGQCQLQFKYLGLHLNYQFLFFLFSFREIQFHKKRGTE